MGPLLRRLNVDSSVPEQVFQNKTLTMKKIRKTEAFPLPWSEVNQDQGGVPVQNVSLIQGLNLPGTSSDLTDAGV
jgi:hypothetical protein